MALIVEDGTGLSTAESLCSVADADAYHLNRGAAAWAALTTAAKEQNLRKATDYMTQAYRLRWNGSRVTATQALDWPRHGVPREDYYVTSSVPPNSIDGQFYYPSDEVPLEVARACAELSLRALSGDLLADVERAVRRERVGPIETEYEPGSLQSTRYAAVDAMLAPFLRARSGFLSVVRA